MSDWTDSFVGDRMAVDREFNRRVADSQFNNQEWGLIMTATELEIENAEDPDEARLVADTGKLPQIMPELENLRSQVGAMGGGGGGADAGSSGGGLVDSIKGALGFGGGRDDERLEAAERLTQEYADELQQRLEQNGKWERVRTAYLE
jgi:hypothetical protein